MKSVLYVTTTFPTLSAFIENEVKRIDARGVKIRVLTLRKVCDEYQPEHAHQYPALAFKIAPQAAQCAARILRFGDILQ